MAIWTAVSFVPLTMVAGLGLAMGQWALAKVEQQRTADIAATAGMLFYNTSGQTAQTAANAAADLAEANGAASGTRTWNAATQTLSDNAVTVVVGSGVKHASDTALTVTLARPVPAALGIPLAGGGQSYTVRASATAELLPGQSSGPQPCLVTLSGSVNVSLSNGSSVNLTSCSLVSNDSVSVVGGASLNASGVYAAGTITTSNGGTLNKTPAYQHAGTLSDPYASNTAVQTAFSDLTTQTSKTCCSSNGSMSPGTYASISVTNGHSETMNPGLYVVTGSFSLQGGGSITGSGVTIVAGGQFNIANGTTFKVSAPSSSANGGIPGMLLLGNSSSQTMSIAGGSSLALSGVLYFPNGQANFSNGSGTVSSGCLELIASSVVVTGGTSLSGSCSSLGAASFGSEQGASSVALVQ